MSPPSAPNPWDRWQRPLQAARRVAQARALQAQARQHTTGLAAQQANAAQAEARRHTQQTVQAMQVTQVTQDDAWAPQQAAGDAPNSLLPWLRDQHQHLSLLAEGAARALREHDHRQAEATLATLAHVHAARRLRLLERQQHRLAGARELAEQRQLQQAQDDNAAHTPPVLPTPAERRGL